MGNEEHLKLLRSGTDAWNTWLKTQHGVSGDFSNADLEGLDLRNGWFYGATFQGANLHQANLRGSDLRQCDLRNTNLRAAQCEWVRGYKANLSGAHLDDAILQGADFRRAILQKATLCRAYLRDTNLRAADLRQADLTSANLTNAILVETNLDEAILSNCFVYGASIWKPSLNGTKQDNLVITPEEETVINVDDLEIAQFIYLLLDNKKIRNFINTMTSKTVLILGRFTDERKEILKAIHKQLRRDGYLPILFDFEKPEGRSISETVETLASLAQFVIVDLTDASSVPQELALIIPDHQSLPIQPILRRSEIPYSMFQDFLIFPSVLDIYIYDSLDVLLANLKSKVIDPAINKVTEIQKITAEHEAELHRRLQKR